MPKRRFTYVVAAMTFLAVMSWLAVRSYDSVIARVYTGPIQNLFLSPFKQPKKKMPVRDFRIKAAVYYSDATANSLRNPEQYDLRVTAWTRFLDRQRITNMVIDSRSLSDESLRPYNLLILPMATTLSETEIVIIKKFVSQDGHGLIFSGLAGSRNENGEWRDISLSAEIIGGENMQELSTSDKNVAHLALDGHSPLSANIPPGLRLGVNTYDRPVSVSLLEPRSEAVGYWEDPLTGRRELSNARAAIAKGTYRDGRYVWTGFTLGSEIDPFGLKVGEILMRNMLAYASFKPVFGKEAWPEGKQAAVVLSQETDADLSGVDIAAALMSQKRVPGTFFCLPEAARQNTTAFRALAANPLFEIGLQGTAAYRNQPKEAQQNLLLSSRGALESAGAGPVNGFSPLDTVYDGNTVQALLHSDYAYIAGDSDSESPPAVLQARKPKLIRRGRDLRLFIKFAHAGPDKPLVFEQLKLDFDAAYQLGGFYTLSFHSRQLTDPAQAQALSDFLDYIRIRNVWLTRFKEVADWTSQWLLVDVASIEAGKTRSNLLLTNNSHTPIPSLRIRAYLPDDVPGLNVISEKLGGKASVVSRQDNRAILDLRDIRSDSRVFYVDRQ